MWTPSRWIALSSNGFPAQSRQKHADDVAPKENVCVYCIAQPACGKKLYVKAVCGHKNTALNFAIVP